MWDYIIFVQVEFARLDQDNSFLDLLFEELEEKQCFASNPGVIVPHIMEFLTALFAIRRHVPKVSTYSSLL